MRSFYSRFRNPITFLLLVILAGGFYSYTQIKTALFPEITFPKIKIIADNGEQTVDKMMVTVTRPLENAVKQVPDLKIVRSTTSRGSCEISVIINWDADIDNTLSLLQTRISEITNDLPSTVQIKMEKMNPSILQVMGYTLAWPGHSQIEQKTLALYKIKPFLSQVEGVSSIAVMGGKTREFWIELNPEKMTSIGVTPDVISNAIGQTNFISSNGYLNDYRRMYLTVTDAALYNKADIENVVIRNDGKRIVYLKDVANVEIKEKVEFVRINANGADALLLAVLKQPDANLIDVSGSMEARVKELMRILPKGVIIKPYYVQADFVTDTIQSVSDSLWVGLLLAIIVAIIFLRSFRASATILITIPVTLGLTLIVLYFLGFTFNIMTIGAIAAAIGLIIDDAIVVVEQIHRTHEEYPDEKTSDLLSKSIKFLWPSMVGSSLSTIVIFIPFVLMSGVAGAYFKVLTNTMIITLVCSFLVTFICLPVIYLLFSGKTKPGKIKQETHHVKIQKWVPFFIKRPYLSLILAGGLIASIVLIYPKLETGFLPEMDEGAIVLDYTSPPGTSLDETDRMMREVEKIILAQPEVQTYSRRTGTEMGFYITEPNKGDYLIQLKKKRNKSTEEVIDELRGKIEATQPALRIDFGQVIGDMLGDLMASTQPVEIKIFGDNQQILNNIAKQVANEIEKVKGTADVFNGITIAGPSVDIKPNSALLAQYNITPANFQTQLQYQLEGNVVGNVISGEQLVDIRLIYPGYKNASLEGIRGQSVFLPNGKLRRIEDLAAIEVQPGAAEIQRENLQSMTVVTARLNNRDLGSVMSDIHKAINKNIALPSGYHISFGGAYAEQEQSFKELLFILVTVILLVFTVMLFLFRDFKAAFIIISVAVLGVSGSYMALFFTHTPLNVGSYTGLIMIVGIIGENAIFTFQQFSHTLKATNVDEAITYSISTRLRPKLMTAIGAIIALMPLALGIGTGAQLHQPLAIAVIGGFVVAMPLLLIVLPSLLRWAYSGAKERHAKGV